MGEINNLSQEKALQKLKEMAEDIMVCMFCTMPTDPVGFETRPMSVQKVDDNGHLWFFSARSSHKNQELKEDNSVQLLFAKPDSSQFLQVKGKSRELYDRALIDELWNPMVKAWFQGGKDDPELTVIEVIPEEAYYWDTKNNRMISFLKIAASVVSGKTMDDGVEGLLNID